MNGALITPLAVNFLAPVARILSLAEELPSRLALALSIRSDAPKVSTISDSYYVGEVVNYANNCYINDYLYADIQLFTSYLTYLNSVPNAITTLAVPVTGLDTWPVNLQNITTPVMPLRNRQAMLQWIDAVQYLDFPILTLFVRLIKIQSNVTVYGVTKGYGDALVQDDAMPAAARPNANTYTYPVVAGSTVNYQHGAGLRNATAFLINANYFSFNRHSSRSLNMSSTSNGAATANGLMYLPDQIFNSPINNLFSDAVLHEGFLEFTDRMPLDMTARATGFITQVLNNYGIGIVAGTWAACSPQTVIRQAMGLIVGNINLAFSAAYFVLMVAYRYWLELCTMRPEFLIPRMPLFSSIVSSKTQR